MKNLLAVIAVLSIVHTSISQTTNLGGPLGWNNNSSATIPVQTMPGYDQAIIDAEDGINDQTKEQPWRFGYKYQSNINLSNAGVWTTFTNGDKLWQMAIECPGAMTVNLLLENYYLPDGAYLYLYDINQTNRVGAYTSRNNRDDGLLGTELIHGEKIIVEYFEPAAVAGQGSFTITDVIHGYRSLDKVQRELIKGLNDAGDCNIDVNCPLGTGWEDQIRSVAMIVVGGNGSCTGALINNTCNDGTPYFLTANHCLSGSTGSWAFRFNWQSPSGTESCATTAGSTNPGPPYDQTANGCTVLENGTQADFALVEIDNMTITDAQNWNCFYAGWDNTDALTVTQATGIHHPSGDVKKICREDNSPYHQNQSGAAVWWIDDWDQGVTEPGSSGSPLFDQNGRIIGQLYGGAAACNWGAGSTSDNDSYDFYGRFGVSWVNGVSDHLAPTSCGSATTNDGFDPNIPPCNGTASSSTVEEECFGDDDGSLTITISGGDAPFQYDIGSGQQGSDTFTNLSQGSYTIEVEDNLSCVRYVNVTLGGPAQALGASSSSTNTTTGFNGTIDLSPTGGTLPYNFLWSGPNGFNSSQEDPTGLEEGGYSVTITDANGCTTTHNVEVGSSVGISSNSFNYTIFPNPSNGIFHVELQNMDSDVGYEVIDVTGRSIIEVENTIDQNFSVDLSNISNGSYFFVLTTGEQRSVQAIVKQ
jgi:V8-like Glu-specific endopeptidase